MNGGDDGVIGRRRGTQVSGLEEALEVFEWGTGAD